MHGRILCVHRWSFCLSSFRQPHWGDGYCYCLVPARIKFPPKTELKKKKTATLGDINRTRGKEKAFRYHRICPWTGRYVGTLGVT